MNKYLIPICLISDDAKCWIEVILARSHDSCKEKLMEVLLNKFSCLKEASNYNEFVRNADWNNIIIGKIIDIDELI